MRENNLDQKPDNISREGVGTSLFATIGLWGFSVLLFATGLFTAIATSITVFGLIVGIIMMVIAVYIPFAARGNWLKKYVSKE